MSFSANHGDASSPPAQTEPRSPYVFVPVPEELESEISQLVLQLTFRETLTTWDESTVRRIQGALGDRDWGLVTRLAEAGHPVSLSGLSAGLGVTVEELRAARSRVTAACATLERLELIVEINNSGESSWGVRRAALSAVRTVLAEHPPPTGG